MNRAFFLVFFALWCGISVINMLKPTQTFSENENRYLAKLPSFSLESFIEGNYMRKIDDFVNDQFIGRDKWISTQGVAEFALGKRESNGVYIGKNALLTKLNPVDETATAANIKGINAFANKLGVPAFVMLVPSAGAVQTQNMPPYAHDIGEIELINNIYSQLDGATAIDAASALKQHSGEYIYYRTDHHWTTYGAFLAYREYCSKAGLQPAEFTATAVSDAFKGTLYSKSGVRFIDSDEIERFDTPFDGGCTVDEDDKQVEYSSVYFNEYLDDKDKYALFLGPNQAVVTLHGTNNLGKSLLVFKDSYAHCFAPMLLKDYDTITLIDLRYFNGNLYDFAKQQNYSAVLHLYSLDTFVHQNNSYQLLK